MTQTRAMSAVEAVTNVVVGYGLAVGMQVILFPLFGLYPSLGQSMQIGILFTGVSLLHSYAIRRMFNRLRDDLP